ncbi:hypothetical protein U9M48_029080, partial [Paspalum notatum var. saurae]
FPATPIYLSRQRRMQQPPAPPQHPGIPHLFLIPVFRSAAVQRRPFAIVRRRSRSMFNIVVEVALRYLGVDII